MSRCTPGKVKVTNRSKAQVNSTTEWIRHVYKLLGRQICIYSASILTPRNTSQQKSYNHIGKLE